MDGNLDALRREENRIEALEIEQAKAAVRLEDELEILIGEFLEELHGIADDFEGHDLYDHAIDYVRSSI